MDLSQLQAIAGDCLSGGTFNLPPERFGDSAIRGLFRAFFPTGVRLGGAARTADGPGGAVRVTGRTVEPILALSDVSACVEMGMDGGAPYLSLRLSALPFAWTPATSFTGMGGTLVEAFTWQDVALTLDSRKPDALPDDFEQQLGRTPPGAALLSALKRGLTLEATLRPGMALQGLGWLLGTPRVRGAVEPDAAGAPRMWLKSGSLGEPVTLGTFTLPFGFELLSVLVEPGGGKGAVPSVDARCVAGLAFDTGSGTVTLPRPRRSPRPSRRASRSPRGRPKRPPSSSPRSRRWWMGSRCTTWCPRTDRRSTRWCWTAWNSRSPPMRRGCSLPPSAWRWPGPGRWTRAGWR